MFSIPNQSQTLKLFPCFKYWPIRIVPTDWKEFKKMEQKWENCNKKSNLSSSISWFRFIMFWSQQTWIKQHTIYWIWTDLHVRPSVHLFVPSRHDLVQLSSFVMFKQHINTQLVIVIRKSSANIGFVTCPTPQKYLCLRRAYTLLRCDCARGVG